MKIIITDSRITASDISRATLTSAGLDLKAMFAPRSVEPTTLSEPPTIVIDAGESVLIPTGLKIWIEDPGYVGLIFPRSGTGHKRGLVLGNGTGVIDADYQGPLMVSLLNRTSEPVEVSLGERIAQLVIVPVHIPTLEFVTDFNEESERGENGFGSSGTR
jgi:dUTP pyrophosphatase